MVCGLHKEVGAIKAVPVPESFYLENHHRIAGYARQSFDLVRTLLQEETNPEFDVALIFRTQPVSSIKYYAAKSAEKSEEACSVYYQLSEKIELAINKEYGVSGLLSGCTQEELDSYKELQQRKFCESIGQITSYSLLLELISCLIGFVFGRWDVRFPLNPGLAPKPPDPFNPLPVCPPGMLIGSDGLPAESGHIVSEEWLRARPDANTLPPEGKVMNPTVPDTEYPVRISWDGILVDDPGFYRAQPHKDDVVCRIREVLDVLWKNKAHEIEQEACDILGVSELRDYFQKPSGFFQDHLKRYSKSRRKAPIYWPLSTDSDNYKLWIYYHCLTDQTLYTCLTDFIEPKIKEVSGDIDRLQKELADGGNAKLRGQLETLMDFHQELIDFSTELLRVAKLPYKPNLNDGVMITAAPLWKLFRFKPWQKDLKSCWEKLKAGEYDWAHIAYSIWPDRVLEKCKTDRSIAIAHDLEELCEVEPNKPKRRNERTSNAI